MVALVVQPGGGHVGVAQPRLHLGEVGAGRFSGAGRGLTSNQTENCHKGYYFYQSAHYVTVSTNDGFLRQWF
jgi:hypothetical protein